MPIPTLRQARSHQAELADIAAEAGLGTARGLGTGESWNTILRRIAEYQMAAVEIAADQMAKWLGGDGALSDPSLYAGVSSYGFPISEPLIATIDRVAPAPLEPLPAAWWDDAAEFQRQVEKLIASEVLDAARTAAQAEMIGQGAETYVRLLNPPSCKRCVPLAGRIYRWNEGFLRHPGCDCIHVPVDDLDEAKARGLFADPEELLEKDLITGLSAADTKAIADGADINEVVNATRGTSQPGITSALTVEVNGRRVKATTAQTTKRALWRKKNPTRMIRLRPEAIYRFANDPDHARRLLELNGYIKPAANRSTVDPPAPTPAGAGGDGKPPVPPGPLTNPDPDPNEPPASDHQYWDDRAAATSADLGGARNFEPAEVRFLERFADVRGEQVGWVPEDPPRSTSDFRWISNGGLLTEVKSPEFARFDTIRRSIERAVIKSVRNPANGGSGVKKNFIIDLGAAVLTDQLRRELEGYNERPGGRTRVETRIRRLWVLSENGTEFEEINLRG